MSGGFSNKGPHGGTSLSASELLFIQTADAGVILIEEASAPAATAGFGKIYVKSSDSLPYFKDDSGNEYSLVNSGAGDVNGPSSSTDNTIVRFNGATGKVVQGTSVTIDDNGGIATIIANSGNTVGLTVTQNDTTNNPRAVDITNAGTGNAIRITQSGDIAASRSVGGAISIINTNNDGNAMVIYSNNGATQSGRLLHITADNVAFDTELLYLDNDSQTTTTLGIVAHNDTQGMIKLTHVADSGSADSDASAISIDLTGASTAAQGIFLTSTTGGTTGKLLNLRNNLLAFGGADSQVELLTLTGEGKLGIIKSTPTAYLHLPAGTSSANTAPLKFTAGSSLSAVEAGAVEFDGTDLFYTTSTPTRRTVVNTSGTQTLTNKTLTAPVISTISNTGTLTLPTSTDTLVGKATTDTFTNKTMSASSNVLGGVTMTLGSDATGDIYYRNGSGVLTRLAIGSSGDVLKVSAGIPSWSAATGTGITWNSVTGTTQTASVNNAYIVDNASLVTVTLPDTAAVGDIVRIVGKGAGGWRLAQNASESVNFGNQSTTSGVGGRLDSTHRYDSIELVCITANTTWNVISSVGNITVT